MPLGGVGRCTALSENDSRSVNRKHFVRTPCHVDPQVGEVDLALRPGFVGLRHERLLDLPASSGQDLRSASHDVVPHRRVPQLAQLVLLNTDLPDGHDPASLTKQHGPAHRRRTESGLANVLFRNALYLDTVPLYVGGPAVLEHGIALPSGEGQVAYAPAARARRGPGQRGARPHADPPHPHRRRPLVGQASPTSPWH